MDQLIIERTYELIDEIKQRNDYLRLKVLEKKIENDKEVQALVKAFNESKSKYDEVKKYGEYHPDLASTKKLFQLDKYNLFSHPIIKDYKEAEKSLQGYLDKIADNIGKSISPNVKKQKTIGYSERGEHTCSKENV